MHPCRTGTSVTYSSWSQATTKGSLAVGDDDVAHRVAALKDLLAERLDMLPHFASEVILRSERNCQREARVNKPPLWADLYCFALPSELIQPHAV